MSYAHNNRIEPTYAVHLQLVQSCQLPALKGCSIDGNLIKPFPARFAPAVDENSRILGVSCPQGADQEYGRAESVVGPVKAIPYSFFEGRSMKEGKITVLKLEVKLYQGRHEIIIRV